MTVVASNAMRTPQIYQTLAQELAKAFPDSNAELSFIELERLPYPVSLPAPPSLLTTSLASLALL
jgi:hypothetical protein